MLETPQKLLLEKFLLKKSDTELFSTLPTESVKKLDNLSQLCSPENLSIVLADETLCIYTNLYIRLCDGVRYRILGKTAVLWTSYMDHIS